MLAADVQDAVFLVENSQHSGERSHFKPVAMKCWSVDLDQM